MSASMKPVDKEWLLKVLPKRKLTSAEETFINMAFDQHTNQDIKEIEQELENHNFCKRVALHKLLIWLPETITSIFLYDRKTNDYRRASNKLYFKLLFKKITYDQFKKDLSELQKSSRMI